MMPGMLDEAKFRNEIKEMNSRELAEATALRVFFICDTCEKHSKLIAEHTGDIAGLKTKDKKNLTGAGAIGGGIGMGLGVVLMAFLKKIWPSIDF
jgi:hypothetical protein